MSIVALIPTKHPQDDLFICDVADAILKDITPHMEHPFYSLSKKPDTKIRRYEHNGNWLEITPSVKGMATIYDKDILIYAISQIVAKLNRGEKVHQRVRINSHDVLMFTNRGTSGKDYNALIEAISRLAGTRISTNIKAGDEEEYRNIGLIEEGSIRRKNGLDGRLLWVELKLSDWVFNSISTKQVLTLHRDYFRLRKPIERRIYEIARKHCGNQDQWSISLELLHKKSGSKSQLKEFRRQIKEINKTNHLPDYYLDFDSNKDKVNFISRMKKPISTNTERPQFSSNETYERAKKYTHGRDVYALEQDWIDYWIESGSPPLLNPDAAFIGFCKSRYIKNKQETAAHP